MLFVHPQARYRDYQITTNAKLLDITHTSYGFSGNLIEPINYVVRLVLLGVITSFVVMCKDSW